jgi:MoxR-like ATPase
MDTSHTPAGGPLLRALGIVGWDHLEPVILAALATESPLLLIGPHGSAKTLILNRLADALGLVHRHYNASLLNFDDLVGFPIPENGRLVYLQTPATIWDAESVLFDEVSRCRPEMQNKLFPIVHERTVQGMRLEKLRHRWGAMNPAPSTDAAGGAPEYAGTEPLDIALADRFAFIVSVPSLGQLNRADQLTVLRGLDPSGDVRPRLLARLDAIRRAIPATTIGFQHAAAEYVQVVAQKLAAAEHPLSTRRAVQLTRNIVAVAAALNIAARQDRDVQATEAGHEDSVYTALRHSLPDEAWGAAVPPAALLLAHRAAWQIAKLAEHSEERAILSEPDPMQRIALTLASSLTGGDAGRILADAFSSLPRSTRLVTAAVLAPLVALRKDLPAGTVEAIARDFAQLASRDLEAITVRNGGADWRREILSTHLPVLDQATARGRSLANAAIVLMQEDDPFEMADLETAYDRGRRLLGGVRPNQSGIMSGLRRLKQAAIGQVTADPA